jgi:hypothetical protein
MAWVVLANCQTLNTKTPPITVILVSNGYTAQPAFSDFGGHWLVTHAVRITQ